MATLVKQVGEVKCDLMPRKTRPIYKIVSESLFCCRRHNKITRNNVCFYLEMVFESWSLEHKLQSLLKFNGINFWFLCLIKFISLTTIDYIGIVSKFKTSRNICKEIHRNALQC